MSKLILQILKKEGHSKERFFVLEKGEFVVVKSIINDINTLNNGQSSNQSTPTKT
jgi:hypothetical protein